LQKKGGNFVCKFFETFTKTSLKIVSIMRDLYEAVYFVKPLTSRPSNSEKYAVCINFKYDDKSKDFKTISKKLDILLQTIHGNKNEKEKIIDIFTDYEIPKNLILSMINLNREISNPQFKNIGEIVTFIEREIYSGDEYHDKRDEQIKGASFWLDLFLPKTSQELEKNRKKYDNLIKQLLISFDIQVKELEKLMVHVENQN
jgi:hypothetical protein